MRFPGALVIIAVVLLGCAPKNTAAPAPSDAPSVLTKADMSGAGWRTVAVPGPLGWSFALTGCPAYQARDYPAQNHRRLARAASFTQGHGRTIQILIELYAETPARPAGTASRAPRASAETWSASALTDVRKVLEACPRYQTEQALTSHTIEEDSGDALLIRSDVIQGAKPAMQWWTAVIRKESAVATVTGTNMTAAEVRKIAETQARRL